MNSTASQVYLARIDPSKNMARFYILSVEIDLFGGIVAVKRWGRIGSHGRQDSLPQQSVADALCEVQRLADAKRRRGYRDVGDRYDSVVRS